MSRIGKRPITVPQSIELQIQGNNISFVAGNERKLMNIPVGISAEFKDNKLYLDYQKTSSSSNFSAMIGMARSNIKNIIQGLDTGFKVVLEYNGVGYKALIDNGTIVMSLGYSHEIFYVMPQDLRASLEKPNLLILSGNDKIKLGQVASEIMSFRKTEPYKGKGIKLFGKAILRKEGKKK